MKNLSNKDLERAVLARIIYHEDDYLTIADKLSACHFALPMHRSIMEAIEECFLSTKGISTANIIERTCKKNELITRADIESIVEQNHYFIGSDIETPVQNLIDLWMRRELFALCKDVMHDKFEDPLTAIMDKAGDIADTSHTSQSEPVHDIAFRVLEQLEKRVAANRKNEVPEGMINLGIPDLDALLALESGQVVVVAARPSMGKSTLVRQFALNLGRDHHVKIFTQEMTKESITQLFFASEAKVNSEKLKHGTISDEEYQKVVRAAGSVAERNIEIDYIRDITTMIVSIKKWRMKTDRSQPAIVIVDYLQQVHIELKYANKTEKVGRVSSMLRQLALMLNLVIINVSQLNRQNENRGGDKKPIMSDLRDSGEIEQDANKIVFVHRPIVYGFETDDEGNNIENLAELIIAKNREGRTGTVKTEFIGKYGLFNEMVYYNEHTDKGLAPF